MTVSHSAHNILILAPEMTPYARTGEVSVVIGSLATALKAQGLDVRVAMPRYRHMDPIQLGFERCIESLPVPMSGRLENGTIFKGQDASGVVIYLVDNQRYFGDNAVSAYSDEADAFVFFSRASLEMLKRPEIAWRPDVVHCHEWQTALVPNWLATIYKGDAFFADTATVCTVHRLSHQGLFGFRVLQVAGIAEYGFLYHSDIADLGEMVDLLGRGLYYADAITTVSESYAREIQTPEFGEKLDPLLRDRSDRLFGIINGLDVVAYNPATDGYIEAPYDAATLGNRSRNKAALQALFGLSPSPNAPLIGMVSRLSDVKGLDLLVSALDPLMAHMDVQLAIMGVGEGRYHEMLTAFARRYAGRMGVQLTFSDAIGHKLYAGADMFLMPSRVEPCGLGQMIAMRYGSVPIVRAVGGLADTVEDYDGQSDTGTGFSFQAYDVYAFYTAIVRACEVYRHEVHWRRIQRRGMAKDLSWDASAARYVEVYNWALAQRRQGHA
jgi:starch synthase